jgi:hypothetical protein
MKGLASELVAVVFVYFALWLLCEVKVIQVRVLCFT